VLLLMGSLSLGLVARNGGSRRPSAGGTAVQVLCLDWAHDLSSDWDRPSYMHGGGSTVGVGAVAQWGGLGECGLQAVSGQVLGIIGTQR
jgi:hypothetical protein